MLDYKIELLEKNVWTELGFWVRPVFDTTTLDDTLDAGKINLSMTTSGKAIKPFTRLRIRIYENEVLVDTIQRVVGSTKKTKRTYPNGKILYDWDIETLELTKLLEREICDSMTVTNYLGKEYAQIAVEPIKIESSGATLTYKENAPQLLSPYFDTPATTIDLPTPNEAFKPNYLGGFVGASIVVTKPDNTQITVSGVDTPLSFVASDVGMYYVKYTLVWGTVNQFYDATVHYYFYVVNQETEITKEYSISEVIERLLTYGVTRRQGIDAQPYGFAYDDYLKYATIKAPEFYFTRSTLFEALLQVGAYIHAIPRLVDINNALYVVFDELGGDTIKEITTEYSYEERSYAIDDYCGALDSPVDNLLNSRDKVQGAITEPSTDTYKTVRCEEGAVEISFDTMIILAECPIYQATKLEIAFEKNGTFYQYDITPYLYESAEYETLSSYWGSSYPYSKAYALTYTQGDNKITGLNFKQTNSTTFGTAWDDPAIVNIIQAVSGIKLSTADSKSISTKLGFRLTYIPIIKTRIVQKKSYAGYPLDNTLIYNQSANTVESELYGDKMKGAIARLGNEIVRRTYYFSSYDDLPKCGELVDIDGTLMYVAIVDREFDYRTIKATITYTPNFNKLAEYVGLNSNFRLYDISEKQSVDRYINYGEYIAVFEDNADIALGSPRNPMFHDMVTFAQTFTQAGSNGNISAVLTSSPYRRIARPVVSFASGNSLCFEFDYMDNFGAGYQSTNNYDENTKRIQRLVSYTDIYGGFEILKFEFTTKLWTQVASDLTSDIGNSQIYPEYTAAGIGRNFGTSGYPLTETQYPLFINKDSREALKVMIQLHFVTMSRDIVIGPALGQNNALVTSLNSAKAAVAYFLPHTVNMLNSTIDLTGAIPTTYEILALSDRMSITIHSIPTKSKSWVIIDPTNNKLLIGRNKESDIGQSDKIWLGSLNNARMKELQEEME